MHTRSRGSALLSALLIMALITMLVTAMVARVRLDIEQTQRSVEYEQILLSAPVVTFWAMERLKDTQYIWISEHADGRIADFPAKLFLLESGMIIRGEIYDLQANFNLNNLLDNASQPLFYELLKNQQSDRKHNAEILTATINWIRKSTSHGPLHDISEFRIIPRVNAHDYLTLNKYLTVLPAITPINLNTAPIQILRALGHGLSLKEAQEIIAARGKYGIKNIMEINEILNRLNIQSTQVAVNSNFFLLVTRVTGPHLTRITYTVLQRYINPVGRVIVRILSTSL